jgi:5-methylcytosine-specific restriction endonuclease McrA
VNKTDRIKIYKKYDGHCAYCGKPIDITEMQVDHIEPKRKGGQDSIDNYNPSCRRCNHYKRSLDLEQFREYIKTLHERIARDYITKVGLDYGIVKLEPFDGRFHFEKID